MPAAARAIDRFCNVARPATSSRLPHRPIAHPEQKSESAVLAASRWLRIRGWSSAAVVATAAVLGLVDADASEPAGGLRRDELSFGPQEELGSLLGFSAR
jgi:hypothetical protein